MQSQTLLEEKFTHVDGPRAANQRLDSLVPKVPLQSRIESG